MVTTNCTGHGKTNCIGKLEMLYLDVADTLKQRIQTGAFLPGDRVPSLRALARQMKMSIATVQQAYRQLEDDGWLEARPQSGYYVRPQMPTLAATPKAAKAAAAPSRVNTGELTMRVLHTTRNPGMVQLGAAVPHASFLPTPGFERSLRDVKRRGDTRQWHRYEFPPGLLELRRQIARRCNEAGFAPALDEILVTNGCQEALVLSLRAVAKAGDVIAVESPTFYGILQAIESLQMKALEIPCDPHTGISLDALALALEQWPVKACVCTPNFNNPLGACMNDDAKRRLVNLLAQNQIPLIEDDIYGELAHVGTRPNAAKAFDRQGNVIYCSSFSKTVSPGLRVGWLSGGRWHERIEYLKYLANFATATPNQALLADFLAHQSYERYLRQVRVEYGRQVARMAHAVARAFPAGTKISQPAGGYVLWVEMPRGVDALELFSSAAEHDIAIAPGPLFSAKGKFRNCVRLNAAVPWEPRVEQAIALLGRLAAPP